MTVDSDDMESAGYSQEEAYFYEVNQKLIEKKRAELDAVRNTQQNAHAKKSHWMVCPKCGGKMAEVDLKGIKIDKCGSCHGIYFDNGELETLIDAKEHSGFFARIARTFF